MDREIMNDIYEVKSVFGSLYDDKAPCLEGRSKRRSSYDEADLMTDFDEVASVPYDKNTPFLFASIQRCPNEKCQEFFYVNGKSGIMDESRHKRRLAMTCPHCGKETIFQWLDVGGSVDITIHKEPPDEWQGDRVMGFSVPDISRKEISEKILNIENFVFRFCYCCPGCKEHYYAIGKSAPINRSRHGRHLPFECPHCGEKANYDWLDVGGGVDVGMYTEAERRQSKESIGSIIPKFSWSQKKGKRFAFPFDNGFLCGFCYADMFLRTNYRGEKYFQCPNKTKNKCYITRSMYYEY